MFIEILELIIDSMEGAFIEVGSFVGSVLLLFGYINYKKSGKFMESIEKSKKFQPLIGGVMGLTPGCGGAVFMMPLFFKKSVTFGTVVAALMATMGDAAFVMIATRPFHYLIVSGISLTVGVITGYLVDLTSLGDNILKKYENRMRILKGFRGKQGEFVAPMTPIERKKSNFLNYLFWSLISIGLVFGVAGIMQVDIELFPNLEEIIGVAGVILAIFLVFKGKKFLRDDTTESEQSKVSSLKKTFIENALETAFVIMWVFVGFLAYELLTLGLGMGDYAAGEMMIENWLLATGIVSIIIGVAVGIIPGCGPQIIFITLFINGLVPFSALLANAISQDGDALFPLIAIDRRSAVWATAINKLPALVFAFIVYWIELNYDWSGFLNSMVDKLFM
ncbi:arsenic efflux protein [Alkalicella caledoniensis]|uniref:Arsenic efflux protein n=1 Tax=Alkalicella caledoniensis TaxID=2731377 RepID=A0A7G9W6D7_ALKCA|nr:putative manganese transporter [Alkalicella caledoniensis]QNO14249.1 arsenic efflux protein [Alkalicella caledoniensis]